MTAEKPVSLLEKLSTAIEGAVEAHTKKRREAEEDRDDDAFLIDSHGWRIDGIREAETIFKQLLAEVADSWPRLCAFYLEEGTGQKDADKRCENCLYHPENIHELNNGLTKDEWHSTPCEFPDTKKRIFR